MKALIKVPSPLRRFTQQKSQVEVEAATVFEAITQLCEQHPELELQLFDEQGQLRNFVNLFLDRVDIKQQDGLSTSLHEGCELRIVPAIAGGVDVSVTDSPIAPGRLTPKEISRYSRHIMLPEIGMAGQQKLKDAKVLIIGAGGLGSPLCLYLVAAGVGTLGLVDHDTVDETNLQRQILFTMNDLGQPKVSAARERLMALNPDLDLRCYPEQLTAANALEMIGDYDLVIDGTDNFPTRYLVNDACVLSHKPNIYGSIFRFDGQATVFHYQDGPCYRCLYPEPPPPGLVPSCAEGGVLGVLPAMIASIQATEAIKMITGAGTTLSGRLLIYDALNLSFEELRIERNPHCCLCGDVPTITGLIDYQQFCGIPATPAEVAVDEITAVELRQRMVTGDVVLVDVREAYEREICLIRGSRHIPMSAVTEHLAEFHPDQTVVFHCKMGGRSAKVCQQCIDQGVTNVVNLKGGILAWIDEVEPGLTKY
ncbi:molybdopterin-synthase adenylyltransferase MoeB [Photobacterium atrarenae]|uniref:Molybdopterin-synthase adenylyltransferase MoeB n=1 Tax=Photobacterium atrarenae TaxID=865757 RepID=A0ABY5GL96_9GAMM|nr:molybdopterin-synthase adenylyltransferase MoeB [Photobacterium atrarenae]UTV29068.1 molybdopterin-synthase adenylyltransferase MoeB [Photobacterium atrarenae]